MWDRKLEVLGETYNLDQVNLDIWNENRLPRYLLFRQCWWGQGESRRPGDLILEVMSAGSIASQMLSLPYIASQAAQNHPSFLWTLVELGWYESKAETGPHVLDIRVYDRDGAFVDTAERDRLARLAAREAAQQLEAPKEETA